jgi:hypothetical protein
MEVDMTEETTDLVVAEPMEGTYALAMLSDEDFEARLDLLKKGRERIARAQKEYMVVEEDYGTIQGTPKPTLFKPGAEKLLQLYGLVARIETQFVAGDNVTTPPLTFNADAYIHRGSEHVLNNRCLLCDCKTFSSRTYGEDMATILRFVDS